DFPCGPFEGLRRRTQVAGTVVYNCDAHSASSIKTKETERGGVAVSRGMGCGIPLRRRRRAAVAGVGLDIQKVDFFCGLQRVGGNEVGLSPALRNQIADAKILALERHQQTGAEGDRNADGPEVCAVCQRTAKALQE